MLEEIVLFRYLPQMILPLFMTPTGFIPAAQLLFTRSNLLFLSSIISHPNACDDIVSREFVFDIGDSCFRTWVFFDGQIAIRPFFVCAGIVSIQNRGFRKTQLFHLVQSLIGKDRLGHFPQSSILEFSVNGFPKIYPPSRNTQEH